MAKKKAGRRRFGNVRMRASGRWQARYVGPDGIERTAPNTFATEALAEKWLTVVESEIIRNEWTAPEAAEIQLDPYAKRWLKERKLGPRTREVYENIYKLNIEKYLGHLMIGAIRPATIRTWRQRLLSDGRPEPQAVKAYTVLRAILNTAVKQDEILKRNPCRIEGYDTYHTPERPVATFEQVQALAEAMPARLYALVILAALSGLRWGELVALRRCDVDLKAGKVRVVRALAVVKGKAIFGPPKSEAGKRTVNLPGMAVEVMRTHVKFNVDPHDDALLFTSQRGAILRPSNFHQEVDWDETCLAVGLPSGFHFHDLRHLGNQLAAEAGGNTRELMHRMGHSTMRAALVYQHATAKRDREIAKEIDRRLKLTIEHEADHEEDRDPDDDGLGGVLARVG